MSSGKPGIVVESPSVCTICDTVNVKDTVSTNKEDNEVDGDKDARDDRPSMGHDAIVHDVGPLLPCQDLRQSQNIHIKPGYSQKGSYMLLL